jgi:nucleoprotein TPR
MPKLFLLIIEVFAVVQELRSQLDASLREIDELHKARDRQKEMVQAIVNQRDMYRTLLAQNTPLPGDSPSSRGPRRSSGGLSMLVETDSVSGAGGGGEGETEGEAAKKLKEMKEQFDAYRKEKAENNRILHQQLEEMREQTSSMRLDNAKLSSKVCNLSR